ncbi:MAG: peptidoglycan -binding protein [Rhodospirillales bacterium]|nr:peptidoglycan -binding protein [Rhodospirillales bacterium]
MASLARRNQYRSDIWPGYVDALASLLMVLIFLLMIFVISQFFLSNALTGRDQALDKLRGQVSELADLLALERKSNTDLRSEITQLSSELQVSISTREDLNQKMRSIQLRAETAEERALKLQSDIHAADKMISQGTDKIEAQLVEIIQLNNDIEALRALREDLETRIKSMAGKLNERDQQLISEKKLSDSARAQVALLNKQIKSLRLQIAKISAVLDASEELAKRQKVQVANLGKRLNAALAGKVQELSRYRSEFFGKLREILGNQAGVRIVGDRFVFQSEVLFERGSEKLGVTGRDQMKRLAITLIDISKRIPSNIDWILRVDGHTDSIPIATQRFPSNWELSSARAISVVRILTEEGVPAKNLAATGFGEYQPIDPRNDEFAYRRNRRIELKLTQR